jgi:hypothetical protein
VIPDGEEVYDRVAATLRLALDAQTATQNQLRDLPDDEFDALALHFDKCEADELLLPMMELCALEALSRRIRAAIVEPENSEEGTEE